MAEPRQILFQTQVLGFCDALHKRIRDIRLKQELMIGASSPQRLPVVWL